MKKIIGALILSAVALLPAAVFAANPGIGLRDDAPIYTGPVQEGDLEELTADDYEKFGSDADSPEEQYRQYQKVMEHPVSESLVLYKMRVVDRDLALEDFLGFDVPEKLSEARYNEYLSMNPDTVDGRTIHYVYVYHSPLVPAEAEPAAS